MIYEQLEYMQRNMAGYTQNIEDKLQRFYETGAEKKFGLDNIDDDNLSQLSGKSGMSASSAKLSSLAKGRSSSSTNLKMDPMMKYENRKIDRIAKEAMANLRKAGRLPDDDAKSTGSRSSAIDRGLNLVASKKTGDKNILSSHTSLPSKPKFSKK